MQDVAHLSIRKTVTKSPGKCFREMQFKPHPSCFCVVVGEGPLSTHRNTELLVGAGEMKLYLLVVFNKHAPELHTRGLFTSDISRATSIFTRSHVQPSTASVKLGRKQYRKEKQEVESVSHRLYHLHPSSTASALHTFSPCIVLPAEVKALDILMLLFKHNEKRISSLFFPSFFFF